MKDGTLQVVQAVQPSFPSRLVVGVVQVEQHDHTSLGIDSCQGDDADPNGHAQVITQQVE